MYLLLQTWWWSVKLEAWTIGDDILILTWTALLQAVAVSIGEICRKFWTGENHLCSSSCCDMGGAPSKFAVTYTKNMETVWNSAYLLTGPVNTKFIFITKAQILFYHFRQKLYLCSDFVHTLYTTFILLLISMTYWSVLCTNRETEWIYSWWKLSYCEYVLSIFIQTDWSRI